MVRILTKFARMKWLALLHKVIRNWANSCKESLISKWILWCCVPYLWIEGKHITGISLAYTKYKIGSILHGGEEAMKPTKVELFLTFGVLCHGPLLLWFMRDFCDSCAWRLQKMKVIFIVEHRYCDTFGYVFATQTLCSLIQWSDHSLKADIERCSKIIMFIECSLANFFSKSFINNSCHCAFEVNILFKLCSDDIYHAESWVKVGKLHLLYSAFNECRDKVWVTFLCEVRDQMWVRIRWRCMRCECGICNMVHMCTYLATCLVYEHIHFHIDRGGTVKDVSKASVDKINQMMNYRNFSRVVMEGVVLVLGNCTNHAGLTNTYIANLQTGITWCVAVVNMVAIITSHYIQTVPVPFWQLYHTHKCCYHGQPIQFFIVWLNVCTMLLSYHARTLYWWQLTSMISQ